VDGQAFELRLDPRVAEELGRGAYASVYRMRRNGVDYAVTALHPTVTSDDTTRTGDARPDTVPAPDPRAADPELSPRLAAIPTSSAGTAARSSPSR
jgi:hypothetical protein